MVNPNPSSIVLYPTTSNEIFDIICSLNCKRSSGYDEIPLDIVHLTAPQIAFPLSLIINCSISSGIFPNSLKIAKICPIFKNGDNRSLSNYRPISVLPSFSKIFEKAIYNRLLHFLNSNNSITNCQYGFRRNQSTYMALLNMHDKITEAMDKNEYVLGVYFDLAKAFDSLNHDILCNKLSYYGIRGKPLDLFIDYLSNRKQFVQMNDTRSLLQPISCGVPQGSILGPLLFIIYINDIVNCSSKLFPILFADDTNVFLSNSNQETLYNEMNCELQKLADWFCVNKLSVNAVKTNFMFFGRKKDNCTIPIILNGTPLDRVQTTKFLGVIIDDKFCWKDHINHICNKIAKNIGVMHRLKNILPSKVQLTLYYSLIYSYLTYCNIVWGNASNVYIDRLFILQKRALRIICNAEYRAHTRSLFGNLELLNMYDIHKLQVVTFLYKFLHNKLPASCMSLCTLYDMSTKSYPTRSRATFTIPSCRTITREKCMRISGAKFWNSLPLIITESLSIVSVKREFKCACLSAYSNVN